MAVGIVIPDWTADTVEADDALGMFIALRRKGVNVRVFTPTGKTSLPLPVLHRDDLGYVFSKPEDLVIYHQSAGDQAMLSYLNRLPCRLIVKYHGTAPATSMLPFSEAATRAARRQRISLGSTLQLPADAFLAATSVQAGELRKFGVPADRISILPLFHAVDRICDLADDLNTLQAVEAHAINLASLDDVGPWAALELLLDIVDRLTLSGSMPLHLHLAGRQVPELEAYNAILMRRVSHLTSNSITFHPSTPEVRVTLLRHCDAVVTAQHGVGPEGRSLEALGFGCPVIAASNSDAAEICGPDASCVTTPLQLAGELRRVLLDQELLAELRKAGQARFTTLFRTPVLEARFIDELIAIKQRSLIRVAASTLQPGGEWFGIPESAKLVQAALAISPPLRPMAFDGIERRRSFVDWILREGSTRSAQISRQLNDPRFLAYATSMEVPRAALQLDAGMRLFWTFDRFAHAEFNLGSREDVLRLMRWYKLEASDRYKVIADAAARCNVVKLEEAL